MAPPVGGELSQLPGSGSAPSPVAFVSHPRLYASLVFFAAAVCAGVSLFSAWWSIAGSGAGPGVTLEFLPGNSLISTLGGSSETATYSSAGLSPVGNLYQAVLAVGLLVLFATLIVGALAFTAAAGKIRNPRTHGALRGVVLAVVIVAIVIVAAVPIAQPVAFHDSSTSLCSSTGSSPCDSFWGSRSNASESVGWGADLGWYLEIGTVVLLIAGLVLWARAVNEPWGRPLPPPMPDLGRIAQLKQLLDAGAITQAEFEAAKSRILGPLASPAAPSPTPTTTPSDDLIRLKQMRDAGQLTDQEYDRLRAQVLARL